MKKDIFSSPDGAMLTCMVQAEDPKRIEELMALSRPEGAEAFGMQFCRMKREFRKRETYERLFSLAAPLPVYVTNYRHLENKEKSDETLAEELIELAECGATICDVMGDYFDPCPGELTMDPVAIERQMKLIDELHKRGALVLMSSHVLKFEHSDRVIEIALEHKRRGADITKIVTSAGSPEEEVENLLTTTMLNERLDIPFLFLSGGESRLSRRVGGVLGNCMTLCVHEYDEFATASQPLLSDMKVIRKLLWEERRDLPSARFYAEARGIYRLRVPFDTVYTSVFLIEADGKRILVDTATTENDVERIILPALRAHGITPSDISTIVLTHQHGDHAGGKDHLLRYAPHAEVVTEVKTIADGISTYPLPGHTRDAIGVLDERTGTLITGDGLQGAGVDKYRCYLESPEDYRETLERIGRDERISSILLSHAYEPWNADVIHGRDAVIDCIDKCREIAFNKG